MAIKVLTTTKGNRTAAIGRNPKLYADILRKEYRGGPGAPPPGFVSGTTSQSEWWIYWALFRVFGGSDKDARTPQNGNYYGMPGYFSYQIAEQGGYLRALGSSVVDYIVWAAPHGAPIGIRLQTEFFHIYGGARKDAYDELQKVNLSDDIEVVDIYDYSFLHDPSGAAAIIVCKEAIGLTRQVNPLRAGTAIRASRESSRFG